MDRGVAKEFAEQAHFLFVYSREAHPGEIFPHHTSYEQKVRHAAAFRERGLSRPILIDTLGGQVHRLYLGMPNMTWIVDHTGRVAFKASWTIAPDIQAALEETLQLRELRRQGGTSVVYYREIVGMRPAERSGFDDSLWLGGKKALEDMRRFSEEAKKRSGP